MAEGRTSPEDFLELLQRSRLGRLKVYIGSNAGVGKTYRMLQEAHELKKRGVDVVLGFIETHGRAETHALLAGLEYVPRQRIEYRGIALEEMDLNAVIKRKPAVVVVDEIAHTNAPSCKNRKRYQDVLELLENQMNVICAFNIQHLESLNDLVHRETGVLVRETVPDTFLRQADQVVNLDLAAEDLIERLKAGKIYTADKIPWALDHFFKPENLATLRELALREVAERLEWSAASKRSDTPGNSSQVRGRIMVCMSSRSPFASALLRRGSRMAGRLNTSWFAVYVETPLEAPERIDAETQRYLHDTIRMAEELGAEIVRLRATDPVAALLEFARSHGISDIIIGRSRQPWWRQVLGRSTPLRLVREAEGFDLHIVSVDAERGAS